MSESLKSSNPIKETVRESLASRVIRRYRARVIQGYVFLAAVGLTILAVLAHFFPYFPIDLKITQTIQSINFPPLTSLMTFISLIGRGPIWPLLILFFLIFLYAVSLKWESITALINALGLFILGSGLKDIVQRSRPSFNLVHVLTRLNDYGFPSGHTLSYTAFFGFLAFLTYTLLQHSLMRTILIAVFLLFIILVGPSRIYLGEHWASDTLGGYLLGSLWLLATIKIYRWGKPRFFPLQPKTSQQL